MTAHEDDEQGEVFFDESDIIDEIDVDEEGSMPLCLQLRFPSYFLLFHLYFLLCLG